MTDPDEFDQFYKDVRTRLLLLTYCLTGDLPASRAAVRDAFVVAWHHWRKVSRLEDPEAWVREPRLPARRSAGTPRSCGTARRASTPRSRPPSTRSAKLSVTQRRVLLLTELTTSSLAEMAREVGLPRDRGRARAADRDRAVRAAPRGADHRASAPCSSRSASHVDANRWPRPTIIRRAGAARRRTHTVIGVAATVAALVVTGTLVTDAAGVRPTLARERIERRRRRPPRPTPEVGRPPRGRAARRATDVARLGARHRLDRQRAPTTTPPATAW